MASGDLWAGAEVALSVLACEQVRRPMDVHAVLLNEGMLAERLRSSGVVVHILDEAALNFVALAWRLVLLVREIRPSVIHTHRLKENLLGALAGRACFPGVPSIRTSHGRDEFPPKGLNLARRLARWSDKQVGCWLQAAIVSVSRELSAELQSRFGQSRVSIVHNGIGLPDVETALNERISEEVLVGFAGRFVPVKRLELWLEVAAELLRGSRQRWRFIVAGDGPDRRVLVELAERLGLADRVKFLGFIPDCSAVLAGCDVLLLTSRHEGLPMVVLEALALGTPVVAPRVGGLSEVVASRIQGQLVSDPSPSNLAAAVEEVVANPRAARTSLLPREFTAQVMEENYFQIYLAVTGRSRKIVREQPRVCD